jgi:hypothetical protein
MAFFSPKHAARVASYGRGLKKLRLLSSDEYVVLDRMLWGMRKPGESAIDPSYDEIARESGVGRNTAVNAVKKLVGFGILAKTRRWLFVGWGRKRGYGRENLTARQTTNLYVFTTFPYEFARPTPSTEMDILVARVERVAAATRRDTPLERALANIAATAGLAMPS